jgi:hypothetical protein
VRYLLLVYSAEPDAGATGDRLVARHVLEDASTATTVRVRDGETLVRDGPAETDAGDLRRIDVVDAPSLDEAIAAAERMPAARHGVVEIRPLATDAEAAA